MGHHVFTEGDPLGDNHGVWPFLRTYSICKIAAEATALWAADRFELPTTIARLSVPYGDRGGWPAIHLEMMINGSDMPVHVDAPSTYHPIHEDDIMAMVPGLLGAAGTPATVVNWGGSQSASIEEWCGYLGELTGLTPTFAPTTETIDSVEIDLTRMHELVGPTSVHWKDGMRRMVESSSPRTAAALTTVRRRAAHGAGRSRPPRPVVDMVAARGPQRRTTLQRMSRGTVDFVLFDLGGVLIELGGMASFQELAGLGSEEEMWERWLGCPWVRRFETGGCSPQEFSEGVVAEWRLPGGTGAVPGDLRVLADRSVHRLPTPCSPRSRGAVPIGCCSNTNVLHWAYQSREWPILEMFDHRFLSFELALVKPDQEHVRGGRRSGSAEREPGPVPRRCRAERRGCQVIRLPSRSRYGAPTNAVRRSPRSGCSGH